MYISLRDFLLTVTASIEIAQSLSLPLFFRLVEPGILLSSTVETR